MKSNKSKTQMLLDKFFFNMCCEPDKIETRKRVKPGPHLRRKRKDKQKHKKSLCAGGDCRDKSISIPLMLRLTLASQENSSLALVWCQLLCTSIESKALSSNFNLSKIPREWTKVSGCSFHKQISDALNFFCDAIVTDNGN